MSAGTDAPVAAAAAPASGALGQPRPEALVGVGYTADLDGPVYYTDLGGPDAATAPHVVYVHGLGGNHLNWALLAPHLAPDMRAWAVDLVGFGLTEPLGRDASVVGNAQLLRRFITTVVGRPVTLVGNSMGGLISMLAASASPHLVDRVVLLDPVLPLQGTGGLDPVVRREFMASLLPGVAEWALHHHLTTVPADDRVQQVLELCCHDASCVPPEMLASAAELEERRAAHRGRVPAYLAASRSLLRRLARPRAYWRMMADLIQPVLLLHGVHDRLVPIALARDAARRLPRWGYAELEAGHLPQLEAPRAVAERITGWLSATASQTAAA